MNSSTPQTWELWIFAGPGSASGLYKHGDDLDSAKANAREAIECHLASMIKHGEPIPADETVSTSVLVGRP